MSLENTLKKLSSSLPEWGKLGLNEAQTSQVIVLQVLQALGYDIWNPFEVVAQSHSGGGSGAYISDFRICLAGDPLFIIEVKALDKSFSAIDRKQPVNYVNDEGLRWAVLTNGREWQFYDNNKMDKPAAERLVLTVELTNARSTDYLTRLLSREAWSQDAIQNTLAIRAQEVSKEIAKHFQLSEIEAKLKKELEEGFTTDIKGLAKAIELTLGASERELAKEAFNELGKRLLRVDIAPPSITPSPPKVEPSLVRPGDAYAAITEGMRRAAPNQRKSRSSELTAWLGETELSATNWRDINMGIVETMIALGQKDFVVGKGYIHKTPQERTKRGGELYPPNAYRALSDGDFLFLHDGASGHIQKIRRMLEELEVPSRTLRVVFRKETFFLP